jgi:pimeloyl-ACP methyl ester carboxylesterase
VNAVYFHPLFDEQKCSYRFSYCLSEAMMQQNFVLERPDYRGTGDSSQPFCDVTLETLRQDMVSLISKGADVLIGLRFGASLIFDYASRTQSNCNRMILIEPIFDGHQYIEYLLRKQRLKDHLSKLPDNVYQEETYINLEGYKTRRHFVDQIRSFKLTVQDEMSLKGHQILLLLMHTRLSAAEKKLISQLKQHNHIDVASVSFPDIWERIPMMDYSSLIETVIGWCHER